jgi:hypothetical protein
MSQETDFKKLIDDATELKASLFENDNGPYDDDYTSFKAGAALPSSLLLKAVEALDKINELPGQSVMSLTLIAEKALTEIRAALEGAGK